MPPNPPVVFAGHNAYMMSVARLCRDLGQFTDVTIYCSDGSLRAHRLVLGGASKFLRQILLDMSDDEETVLVMPGVPKTLLMALLDFLYTGKMLLSRTYTRDLQLLVGSLGIDPDNVRVDLVVKTTSSHFAQIPQMQIQTDQLMTKISIGNKPIGEVVSPVSLVVEPSSGPSSSSTPRGVLLRTSKRKSSADTSDEPSAKDPRFSTGQQHLPSTPSTSSSLKGRGRSRARQSVPSGYHDMTRAETWVCAICKCYDPPAKESTPTTEWIGCDCNRWYHKHCTRLKKVDDTFCCSQVNLKCLPRK